MSAKVSILVPFRSDGGRRANLWAWNKQRWEYLLPGVEIIESDCGNTPDFSMTKAKNIAASQSDADIFIFADGDTTTHHGWINEAIEAIHNKEIFWALYTRCDKLDVVSSNRLLNSPTSIEIDNYQVDETTFGVSLGGIVIVPREGYETVGGFDERFTTWGAEDACFAMSMYTLWGVPHRYPSTIYHLWHNYSLPALFGHPDQHRQQLLTQRYTDASLNPEKMKEVRFQ